MTTRQTDPSEEPLRRWQNDGDLDGLDLLLRNEVSLLKEMIRRKGHGALLGSVSASDIAQEAVNGLLKNSRVPTFENPAAFRGYLWTAAWRLLTHRFERRRLAPLDLLEAPSAGLERFLAGATQLGGLIAEERKVALNVAMNLLAKEDRELIRRVYFEDEDLTTAASAIGLKTEVANTRLVRARRLLASRLMAWSELVS